MTYQELAKAHAQEHHHPPSWHQRVIFPDHPVSEDEPIVYRVTCGECVPPIVLYEGPYADHYGTIPT